MNLLSNARVVRVERTDDDVSWLMDRLAAALSGTTRSVLVPVGGQEMPPAVVTDLEKRAARDLEDVRIIVRTSGSTTGHGRLVGLSAAQLTASINATDDRIGGPGTWVLALPPHHIAGLQVVARSVLAGTTPVVLAGSFDAEQLAAAIDRALARDQNSRVHLSLVPTQLVDALADDRCREALARCTSVLLGGAAADSGLLQRAETAGVPVRVTYGMSETCGGCVYDGVPLAGMQVRINEGVVHLGGPMVMSGYLDADLGIDERDGLRWLTTSDLGHLDAGELVIDGRADDVIISGGLKINATEVAEAIRATGMVHDAAVLGLDDQRWGQLVTAVVVAEPGWTGAPRLRDAVATRVPRTHAPRLVITTDELPMLASGKTDRVALRALAEQARRAGRAWARD